MGSTRPRGWLLQAALAAKRYLLFKISVSICTFRSRSARRHFHFKDINTNNIKAFAQGALSFASNMYLTEVASGLAVMLSTTEA